MRTSTAPAASASTASSPLADPTAVVCNTIGVGWPAIISSIAPNVAPPGRCRCMSTTAGRSRRTRSTAPVPPAVSATTANPGTDSTTARSRRRGSSASSTTKTRIASVAGSQGPAGPSALELRPGTDTDAPHRTAAQSRFRYRRPQRWLEPPTSGEAQARRPPRGAYDAADAREHYERADPTLLAPNRRALVFDRRARDLRGDAPMPGRGRCWSARSCCSRPRYAGCCRPTPGGGPVAQPTWRRRRRGEAVREWGGLGYPTPRPAPARWRAALAAAGPERTQRERAQASLVADGLLVVAPTAATGCPDRLRTSGRNARRGAACLEVAPRTSA